MARARPDACTGRALEQCTGCLRYTANPEPYRRIVEPYIEADRCRDQLERTSPIANPKPLEKLP